MSAPSSNRPVPRSCREDSDLPTPKAAPAARTPPPAMSASYRNSDVARVPELDRRVGSMSEACASWKQPASATPLLFGGWLAFRWQAHDGTYLRQRKRPADALAAVSYKARPGVHYDRVVGVRPRWRLVTGRNAMVPVDRLGMDLDDPDQRPGRHPGTNVTLRLGRLALRVRGENEVHPLDAGKEPPARSLYDLPACPRRRHDAGRQQTSWRR
jgi:hypothetical protein